MLSLLQQLACDINNDMSRKLSWMTDVATAINPSDPMITMHVRPIFEQVYQILNHQRNLPSITGSDLSSTRLLLHVINSMLTTCKWFVSRIVQIYHLNSSDTIGILYKVVSFMDRVKMGIVKLSNIQLDIVLFCLNLDTVSGLSLTFDMRQLFDD